MNTLTLIAVAFYVGGIAGYMLQQICPGPDGPAGRWQAFFTALIWPVLACFLSVVYIWQKRKP